MQSVCNCYQSSPCRQIRKVYFVGKQLTSYFTAWLKVKLNNICIFTESWFPVPNHVDFIQAPICFKIAFHLAINTATSQLEAFL